MTVDQGVEDVCGKTAADYKQSRRITHDTTSVGKN
ncbi:hypothetical protein HCH_00307 [Hahella chejuensis KCTC 2396]|uniref:Uncharacterized protein n=1 Tax=Hahella chejuensis (strain KCTC 2396) TaxID=349521 RepID=Q2SQ55_HAHCH|nr:hypothetical protein HCH_00307 [Hahella chejuensis KCTC 2396]